jgi:adenylate kinase
MLGGPGSGKGTQSQQIAEGLHLSVIATGDILRTAMASGSSFGCQAKEFVERGELVPDMMMIEFMRERLQQPDGERGWILEGYPRTAFQAEELDFLLEDLHQSLDWAIYLQVSEKVMIERSLARGNVDDLPEIIQRRIELFHQRTIPILEYYQHKKKLLNIPAEGKPQEVKEEILSQLKQLNLSQLV